MDVMRGLMFAIVAAGVVANVAPIRAQEILPGIPYVPVALAMTDPPWEGITDGVISEVSYPARVITFEAGLYFLFDQGIVFQGGFTREELVAGAHVSITWIKDTADLLLRAVAPAD